MDEKDEIILRLKKAHDEQIAALEEAIEAAARKLDEVGYVKAAEEIRKPLNKSL